ncbi:pentatricopeptide repeat-containing protein At2g35030, mitochondrial [Alnus glutinosa]|jgi:pentatricopeptide repeat protein|uniref:pentatricopeptide repeat-containing protein At2g35030, mitochondrial n=1 Tax=Alnus glutinosa TaxID=3517 RepID=UPI002D76D876|nr:pentatricopeptide repeat-containing protein At2g35030, mitochondrial [Alnus glutinosa]
MLALFRASTSARQFSSIVRSPILNCVQIIIPLLCDLKVLYGSRIDLYHSVNDPGMDKFAIPGRDYSANSGVARSNWLITKLCKEGKICEARLVFDNMCERDVVTWTTVITGYIKCRMVDEARRLFDRVDAKKNVITWTALVSGYIRLNRIKEAERVFYEMPVKNVVSWNTMIDGYARNGKSDLALDLFEMMPERNLVSWNTIITALAQCGRIDQAQRLFEQMCERDVISWTAMVAGLSRNGRIEEARLLFDRMPERNVVSWNAMITGYAQNKRLDEALDLFERMPERDLPSWNTMITGFIQNGELTRAWKLFNEMPQKNVISWTAIITGYIQDGQSEEALKIFLKMLVADGVKPNQGTFVSVLGACSDLAGLSEGQQVHQMISKSAYQDFPFVVSALINMYSKCGELGSARKMFDDGMTSHRDLISWNGMIAAYAHHGCGREAINLFNEMRESGFHPDDVTYVGLLSACSHAGLVEEGLKYFDELVRDGSIIVREDHYTCLVDLFVRAGRLKEAFDFIKRIGTKPSASVLGALLAGCNVHGDEDIGKLAAEELLEVEPENPGTYLLLSNIYASAGQWREAAKVRLKMKDKGLKKQPGCSWIEIGNSSHVFVVGDKSHRQSELICSLLRELHSKIKQVGNVPIDDMIVDDEFSMT